MNSTDLGLGTWIALWKRHRTINHGQTLVCPQRTEDGFPTYQLISNQTVRTHCPNCRTLLKHPQPILESPGDQRWSR